MAKEIFIPKLGQTMEEVTLVAWMVKEGDKVDKGQTVAEVETDKAVFPIESNASGIVHPGPFQPDQVIPVLTVIAIVGSADDTFKFTDPEETKEEPAKAEDKVNLPVQAATPPSVILTESNSSREVFISPRAKKMALENQVDWSKVPATGNEGQRIVERDIVNSLAARPKVSSVADRVARESGIDLTHVQGSGPGGRIMKNDVLLAVGAGISDGPEPEIIKSIPLTGVRGVIFSRMAESTQTTSRVTLFMEADATRFVELREMLKQMYTKDWGYSIGYNDLLARICGRALVEFPYMNARINAEKIEWLGQVHMGMAVDTERGLVVPVIKHINHKPLRQFGQEMRTLIEKARAGSLLPDEMSGGTFTITSLGSYDVLAFTPVINLPQAAILGIGKITPSLRMVNGQVVEYQKLVLSLVFDHRIVDGAPAARFLQWIKDRIENPGLLGFS